MPAIESLKRNPSAALLAVQLVGLLLYPLFGVFGLLVLGVALRVVRRSPWLTWIGSLLALPVVILSVASVIAPRPELVVWTAALEAVFYLYATGSLIAYMWQDLGGHNRRTVCRRRDVHASGLGVRVRLRGVPGADPRQLWRR
jgi:hypothetical protein